MYTNIPDKRATENFKSRNTSCSAIIYVELFHKQKELSYVVVP